MQEILPPAHFSKVICVQGAPFSLEEMQRLLDTLEWKVAAEIRTSERNRSPGTYFSSGKIQEIKAALETHAANGVVVDAELTPNQLKNLESTLEAPVMDRPAIILEIFSRQAKTREAKTQVELAKLQYLLPRLSHLWSHFERQRGGGVGNRGMGETQLEVDRRLVKKRMSVLKERLVTIGKERDNRRKGRGEMLQVAIAGYTNAGKSTLLNRLTHSEVLAEDKLFATLDASVKLLSPDSHPPIVAVDTVGFVSRLPHDLVASFRSTLEEIKEADYIVHVVDGSSDNAKGEIATTLAVFTELGVLDIPRLTVINKMDRVAPADINVARMLVPGALRISALNDEDIKNLRKKILAHFSAGFPIVDFLIPYSESQKEALIHQYSEVVQKRHLEKGTFFRAKISANDIARLGLDEFVLSGLRK